MGNKQLGPNTMIGISHQLLLKQFRWNCKTSKVEIGVDNLHFTMNSMKRSIQHSKCQTPLLLLRSNSTKGFIGLAKFSDAVYLHMSLAILRTIQSSPQKTVQSICHVFGPNGSWKPVKEILVGHRLWTESPKNYYNVAKEEIISSTLHNMKSQPNAVSENQINIYFAGNRETQSCHPI